MHYDNTNGYADGPSQVCIGAVLSRGKHLTVWGLSLKKIVQAFYKLARVSLGPEAILKEHLINIQLSGKARLEKIEIEYSYLTFAPIDTER